MEPAHAVYRPIVFWLPQTNQTSQTCKLRNALTHAAYGRYLLPPHPPHLELINNPDVKHVWRRVFLKPYKEFKTLEEAYDSCEIIGSEEVQLRPEELASGVKRGGRWIFYSVWKLDKEPQGGWEEGGKGLNRDLLLVHGESYLLDAGN